MTNTTPVPPVPSREAVETFTPSNGAMICCAQGTGHYVKTEDYRTLLAEVERLSAELKSALALMDGNADRAIELQHINDTLRSTVTDQAAALAERNKDAERLSGLERLVDNGACPAVVNDDAGRWAVAFDGMQNVPDPDQPTDITTSFFIEAALWKDSIREAIDAALAASVSSASEDKP